MAQQSRRRPTSNLSRRQRREVGARTYAAPVVQGTVAPRRSYMTEPAPVDYSTEYRFIRKDLIRILLVATVLIGAMVLLSVFQVL